MWTMWTKGPESQWKMPEGAFLVERTSHVFPTVSHFVDASFLSFVLQYYILI